MSPMVVSLLPPSQSSALLIAATPQPAGAVMTTGTTRVTPRRGAEFSWSTVWRTSDVASRCSKAQDVATSIQARTQSSLVLLTFGQVAASQRQLEIGQALRVAVAIAPHRGAGEGRGAGDFSSCLATTCAPPGPPRRQQRLSAPHHLRPRETCRRHPTTMVVRTTSRRRE
jgi:hypothetical protein